MPTDTEKSKKENNKKVQEQEESDPGTTNSADPQENMEGPVSSLMHIVEKTFDKKEKDTPAGE